MDRCGLSSDLKRDASKKERPDKLPVRFIDTDGTSRSANLPVEEFPNVYVAVKFPPPGILTGAVLSDMNPEMTVQLKGDRQQIARAANVLQRENIQLSNTFSWGPFCRQIAKIAHAYLIATIGMEGYRPLLNDVILGKSSYLSHFVGGVEPEQMVGSSDLALVLVSGEAQDYLVVYVQLLGTKRLPLYQAVAGAITDIDTIMSRFV